MERDANYAAVGAFVLGVALFAGLFVYWYSGKSEHRNYQRYEIYYTGSVSGLERGSAVRYLGVSVGRVVDMDIDDRDPSRVKITVDVDSHTPISQDGTVAELEMQGVTGLLAIDLREKQRNEHPDLVKGENYPVIRSIPSQLPELLADARTAAARANRLLSDANLDKVSSLLANLDKASGQLPDTLRDVSAMVADLKRTTTQIAAASQTLRTMLGDVSPQLTNTMDRFHAVADNLAGATAELDQVVSENRGDVTTFIHTGLPELQRFLNEGRDAAQQIKELSASLRQNPSQLLYQPASGGVEIPR
jgi:phospholipid/cholesterol/gamma-HCH transport system substrate-binding protein